MPSARRSLLGIDAVIWTGQPLLMPTCCWKLKTGFRESLIEAMDRQDLNFAATGNTDADELADLAPDARRGGRNKRLTKKNARSC